MDEFANLFVRTEQRLIEALVYSARAQGFRAGVRPYTGPQPEPDPEDDEELPLIKRAIFVEYPEKTIEWTYTEVQAAFLDSFPQYDK